MLNTVVLARICREQNVDPEADRLAAELIAVPQDHKCWGLTDAQSDVIATMYSVGDLQASVNLAICHYRKVNETA